MGITASHEGTRVANLTIHNGDYRIMDVPTRPDDALSHRFIAIEFTDRPKDSFTTWTTVGATMGLDQARKLRDELNALNLGEGVQDDS